MHVSENQICLCQEGSSQNNNGPWAVQSTRKFIKKDHDDKMMMPFKTAAGHIKVHSSYSSTCNKVAGGLDAASYFQKYD